MTYEAHVQRAPGFDGHVLYLRVRRTPTEWDYLMSDGTWQTVTEGSTPGGPIGVTLPGPSVQAVAEAFHPYASHKVEVKRLEEALAVERRRVDKVLDR